MTDERNPQDHAWKNMAKDLLEQNPATPDAARLALEERLRAERFSVVERAVDCVRLEHEHHGGNCSVCAVKNAIRTLVTGEDKTWLAEREAKLIAEAQEKAFEQCRKLLVAQGSGTCFAGAGIIEGWRDEAQLAVQGGASRDEDRAGHFIEEGK